MQKKEKIGYDESMNPQARRSPYYSAKPASDWREETVGEARIYTKPISRKTMSRMPQGGRLRSQLPWWTLLFAKAR